MGRLICRAPLPQIKRQDRRPLRTHPTRRPREDIFTAEAERVDLLDGGFSRSPRRLQATAGTAVLSFLLHRNSLPSTHIRCRTTARRLATATIARRIPRRWATRTPHTFSHDHFPLRVSSTCAASYSIVRSRACAWSTSLVSCGLIQRGSTVASIPRLPPSDRATSSGSVW